MRDLEREKKLQSNIKTAAGAFSIIPISTLIYVVRGFVVGDLDFYFCSFFGEFLLKSSGYFEGYKDTIPFSLAMVLFVCYTLFFLVSSVLSNKNFKWLYVAFGVYIFDFILQVFCLATNYFEPFRTDFLVDVIIHLFLGLFVIIGIESKREMDQIEKSEAKQTVKS